MRDLWQLNATEIARLVRTKVVSCAEVIDSALQRLDAVNPRINAVVDFDRDEARASAHAADDALRSADFEPGPLHGVPVTIKINVDQRARATSSGVTAFRGLIAGEDSAVVANWRRAGAIIIGRSNAPEFSLRWFTDNPLHGATLNPWDRNFTPGGSSGGAAAAVATGIGALAHGNDSAGSIRYPALACSVPGLKPSLGRVPSFNPTAAGDRSLPQQIVSVQGVLARRICDIRLGFDAMAVQDTRDPWSMPAPAHPLPLPKDARIAVVLRSQSHEARGEVALAVAAASAALREAGFAAEEVSPPRLDEAAQLWLDIVLASNRYNLAPLVERFGSEKVKNAVRGMLSCSTLPDLETFMGHFARRDTILREWNTFFGLYSAIVMPVSWQPVFAVDADQHGDDMMKEMMAAQSPLLAPSILGLPSAVVPVQLPGGLRQGVQIVAAPFREDICLFLAEQIEARHAVATPIDPAF